MTIALSHLAIDLVKAYCPKGLWSFVLDQAAHLAILAAVATEFDITTELPVQFVDYTGNFSMPLFILAVLLCRIFADAFEIKLSQYTYTEINDPSRMHAYKPDVTVYFKGKKLFS